MTWYYDQEENAIIENHPEFVEFDEEGRLVINIDEIGSRKQEKLIAFLNSAEGAIDNNPEVELDRPAKYERVVDE